MNCTGKIMRVKYVIERSLIYLLFEWVFVVVLALLKNFSDFNFFIQIYASTLVVDFINRIK